MQLPKPHESTHSNPSNLTPTASLRLRTRWADQRRSQFGVTVALFTALSGAGLGFCASLPTGVAELGGDSGSTFLCMFPCGHRTFWFLTSSLAFAAALILGILATVTRLLDFRLTASLPDKRLARRKSTKFGFLSIPATKCWTRALGGFTWSFCWIQLFALVAGIVCIAVTASYVYQHRLFP
jgi:hypothetical protein